MASVRGFSDTIFFKRKHKLTRAGGEIEIERDVQDFCLYPVVPYFGEGRTVVEALVGGQTTKGV